MISSCYKFICLTILISYACSMFACNVKNKECNLQQFIGPMPGCKYFYKSDSGISLELVGLSKDSYEGIEVEEITDMTRLNLPTKVGNRISYKYKISIINDALIKQFNDRKEISLQKQCIPKKSKWEIIGKMGNTLIPPNDDGIINDVSFNDVVIPCQIVYTGEESILGKDRFVIMTECSTKDLDSETVSYEKYAEGIGLIERGIKVISNNKETELFRFIIESVECETKNRGQPLSAAGQGRASWARP